MKVIKTYPGDAQFHLFEQLPMQLYPEAVVRQNGPDNLNLEFLEACYVVVERDQPKARAALYSNPHLTYQNWPAACVGNFECVEDDRIANRLFNAVAEGAKRIGAAYLIGPMNGSTWDNYRLSTHHDNAPFFMEPYHHLYYNDYFKRAGFFALSRYFSSIDTQLVHDQPAVLQRGVALENAGLTMRHIDLDDFDNELNKLYPFVSKAFRKNFLYTPISRKAFVEKYRKARPVIDPRFVLIAEDRHKNIVGFFFCVPDLFNTKEKSLIIKTIARCPGEQWRGLGHVMANHVYRLAVQQQITSIIHAFMKVQGTSTAISKNYSGKAYKNYVLYAKAI